MNISTNLKAIDSMKSAVLCEIARLYGELSDHDIEKDDRVIEESIASVIAMCYMLSRRLGFEYGDIDSAMSKILSQSIAGGHEAETEFGDMSVLGEYITARQKVCSAV